MAELISKYPRIVVALFAAISAGLATALVCYPMHDNAHLVIYISSAMVSSAFWAAIIGKRIADITQHCTYFRAAILGGIAALLAVLSIDIFVDIEMRLENMFNGLASLQQTMGFLLIDDLTTNLGGGLFALLFFGWYLIPMGGLAGIILRSLRKLYEADEQDELQGDERDKLYKEDPLRDRAE